MTQNQPTNSSENEAGWSKEDAGQWLDRFDLTFRWLIILASILSSATATLAVLIIPSDLIWLIKVDILSLAVPFIPIITSWVSGQLAKKLSRQLAGRIIALMTITHFYGWTFGLLLGIASEFIATWLIPTQVIIYVILTVIGFWIAFQLVKCWEIAYPPRKHGYETDRWLEQLVVTISFVLGPVLMAISLTVSVVIP